MVALHGIFGIGEDDRRYKHYLKERIEKSFKDKVVFLTPSASHNQYVLISINALQNNPLNKLSCETNKHVAESLREDILRHYKDLPETQWPPTIEELTSEERKPPNLLLTFLSNILHVNSTDNTLVDSFAQDIIHAVTKGKVTTPKHFLLAMGLHNMTGQKHVVDVVNKLGHSISYTKTCEIETAQAEAALADSQLQLTSILPLKPKSENDVVLTHFWVDNFDMKTDTQTGGGAINITTMVAFQERSSSSAMNHVQRSKLPKRRRLFIEDLNIPLPTKVDPKKEPPKFCNFEQIQYSDKSFSTLYLTWLILRKRNSFVQAVPIYSAWNLQVRSQSQGIQQLDKTVVTYLPPINSKVTEFKTTNQYIQYLDKLTTSSNMPYTNITLDVGAAINAYKFIWNSQSLCSKVVTHLGSFHFMKENFLVS